MSITFNGVTKHGTQTFVPDTPLGFEDEGAEDYFIACGWAKRSAAAPKMVYPAGTVEIDPETIHNESRLKVQDLIVQAEVKEG